MAKVLISTITDEIVEAGRRFGNEWARLREYYKTLRQEKNKWFDNMILKLDSPTAEGFQRILRKMVREFYNIKRTEFKWNISTDVLSLLTDKSRSYYRQAFMTGVFFGYYGYFKKDEEEGKK